MNYSEDDLISLSALSHLLYCERRCALIHIEQVWVESRLTAEGRIMHEHVHEAGYESRGPVRVEHGVALRSLMLGLIGKADAVEFHKTGEGLWQPYPVEYKYGRLRREKEYEVQLCAQAMCLEEMLEASVPSGALYYGRTRHRLDVTFDEDLRRETEEAAERAHELIESGQTPKPVYTKKCERCSLITECLPKTIERKPSVSRYLLGAREDQ